MSNKWLPIVFDRYSGKQRSGQIKPSFAGGFSRELLVVTTEEFSECGALQEFQPPLDLSGAAIVLVFPHCGCCFAGHLGVGVGAWQEGK